MREDEIMSQLNEFVDTEEPERNFCTAADDDYVQPNIVFVLADDYGFNDVGWNNPAVETPVLNQLGQNGIILDRNYVAPVCSPTRGALMTGKYTHRIGMQHGVIGPDFPECLHLDEVTLATRMKELGYATHYVGKWHLGFCNEACLPTNRGFDSYYGFYNGYVDHFDHTISGGYDWWDNGIVDLENNGTYAADLITARAVQHIQNHDTSSPLYMFVSQALVHTPIQVPPGVEASEDERENYLKMATHMDSGIGEIIDALQDKGIYDNTVFIFSSDNGGEHGPSSNLPLRGEKATLFEGGTRVPGMVHSPLQTVTGVITDQTMYVTDWFATLVSLGGGCTDDLHLNSYDQTDLILHNGPTRRHEFIYNLDDVVPQPFGMAAFRMGDYKLIIGYPGLYDGWDQDGNLGLTHILDEYGINPGGVDHTDGVQCFGFNQCGADLPQPSTGGDRRRRGNYNFDWPAISRYAIAMSNRVTLYNVMDDPEEKNDLAGDLPELVEVMNGRLMDLYDDVGEITVYSSDPAGSADNFGGIWTPGWC